jgi:hypothetical protein
MIIFKSYQDLAHGEYLLCHVLGCDTEAERVYGAETKIVDVCLNHYKELIDKDYR